jgi:SSS family solute:Na+ symporter
VPPDRLHAWQTLPFIAPHATMDRFGLIFGLGLVLSFGYWSTDFVLMQRALAVRSGAEVRLVPLGLAASKLAFAFLIVFPGIVAPFVLQSKAPSNWNATLPALIHPSLLQPILGGDWNHGARDQLGCHIRQ